MYKLKTWSKRQNFRFFLIVGVKGFSWIYVCWVMFIIHFIFDNMIHRNPIFQ